MRAKKARRSTFFVDSLWAEKGRERADIGREVLPAAGEG